MKIAIIGAGAGGLAALRHCLKENHACEVFEQTNEIGGTWIYTEKTGIDDNGLPVHTSMYDGLITNLPKELMAYEGFPYKEPYHSFITQPEVLNYIHNFAKEFNLLPHIKFLHHVANVKPFELNRWIIKVQDLTNKTFEEKVFDAVIICVGKNSVPNLPKFQGIDNFKGSIIHSHDYRTPEPYKNKKVLIIGAGPSAVDVARLIEGKADQIIISFRGQLTHTLNEKICRKPIVKNFKKDCAIFSDDTEAIIDSIIICTGYITTFPFLSPECDVDVENNWVKYLYKHIINVKHTTMAFLGMPIMVVPFPLYDIQIRYFLAYLRGNFTVSEKLMMDEIKTDIETQKEKGLPVKYYQRVGMEQGKYMKALAEQAKIKPMPSVIGELYIYHHKVAKGDRTAIYRLINDEEFRRIDSPI